MTLSWLLLDFSFQSSKKVRPHRWSHQPWLFFWPWEKASGRPLSEAAKKNNRNLEAPSEKFWAQKSEGWQVADVCWEMYLCFVKPLWLKIYTEMAYNLRTLESTFSNTINKPPKKIFEKKHLQTCSLQLIQTIFPTFLLGTKRLIPRPSPYQRFWTSLFRCRIANFLCWAGCLDIVLQQIWWSFPREATGLPTFMKALKLLGRNMCISKSPNVSRPLSHLTGLKCFWNSPTSQNCDEHCLDQRLPTATNGTFAYSKGIILKFGRLLSPFWSLKALLIQTTKRVNHHSVNNFWVSNSPFGPSFASFTSKKSAPLPTWKKG